MTTEQLARIKTFESSRKVCFDDEWYEAEREQCKRELAKQNGNSSAERFCDCRELVIDGERQPCQPRHSCQYVRDRSALVPQAEKIANERVIVRMASEDGGRSQACWVKCFTAEMEKLAAPLLKQSGNGSAREQKPI
jgi:hypothetical protein